MAQSFNASLNVSINPQSLNASTKQVSQALGRITGQASEFQKSLDASTARVFAFGATTAVLNGVTQSFKKLVATTVEVEKKLVEINSIFQATEATFNRFRSSIFQVAKDTGQAFNTVAEGAAELARQGLSAEDTAKRLKAALVLTRISGLDAEKSVKALTAAINGFASAGLSANQIVNKMVAVDTAFAVSAQDLAEAFSRAGSTAEDAGVSFDQLLGLVTAVEQRTARGGAVIGNAFKSIFTRLARGTTIEKLKELGVEIEATQSGIQKLSALSNALERISDPTVASKIKELAGGVFQINVVSAALKDLSSETSIFAGAAETAANATNEAFEKNAALNQTIAAQMNALVVGLTSLAEKIGTVTFGPLLENLIGVATKFTDFLDKALDPEKGNVFIKGFFKAIGSFLSGPAVVIFTAAFVKIAQLIARFAAEGMKSLFTMGTQAERIKQIEGGIVGLLQRDANLRQNITSSTITQAQKEQLVLNAIKAENTLLTQQANIMRQLAVSASMRGVRGFGAGGFTGRGFASGFRSEEAEARMLGAPAGVRGQHSSGTIGGKKFIMNNHETEIPNFGRNGDSAVIPHYSRGFVPNYSRVNLLSIIRNRRGNKTPDEIAKAKKDLAAMDKRAADKTNMARLPLKGSGKAMLIPRLNAVSELPAGHTGWFHKGKKRFPYKLTSKLNIRGPQIPKEIDKAGDPNDEKLRGKVADSVAQAGMAFARSIKPVTGKGVNKGRILKQILKQGGGKGALHAVIGSAFEAAVIAGLGIKARKKKGSAGGDFDVRGKSKGTDLKRLNTLFSLPLSTNLLDFKSTASAGGIASFAKKIANEQYGNSAANMAAALGQGKAGGFIPNFAVAGGVPSSKIRIHRNSTGEPLAVTNTRDEPQGLQDAIKREKAGVGMFSSGFVPNYAIGMTMTQGASNAAASTAKLARSQNNLAAATDKTSKSMGDMGGASMGIFMAFGAVQTVMGTMAAAAEQEISAREAVEDQAKQDILASKMSFSEKIKAMKAEQDKTAKLADSSAGLMSFTGAVQDAITALMAFQAINMLSGGGIGRGAGALASKAGRGLMGKGITQTGRRAVSSKAHMKAFRDALAKSPKDIKGANMAARTASSKASAGFKGSGMSKFAGRAGLLGVGVGAFQAVKTVRDRDMSSAQKKESLKSTAGSVVGGLAGAKAGAMLGGLVGGPAAPVTAFIGAIIGGIGGAFLGAKAGKAEKAAKLDAERKLSAENFGMSRLGVKRKHKSTESGFILERESGEDAFNRSINEGLGRISREGGKEVTEAGLAKAEQLQKDYLDAQKDLVGATQGRAKFIDKLGDMEDEDGNKLSKAETKASAIANAEEKMIQATLRIADRRFLDANKEKDFNTRLSVANLKLLGATDELQKAISEDLMAPAALATKRSEADSRQGDIMKALLPSVQGPMSGSVALATEQSLMQRNLNALGAKKEVAGSKLALAEADTKGLVDMDPAEAAKAFEDAGIKFKEEATKAGISFFNKITSLETLLEANAKKRAELISSEIQTAMDTIQTALGGGGIDIGQMTGQAAEIGDEISKGDKMDPAVLAQLVAEWDPQGMKISLEEAIIAALPNLDPTTISDALKDATKDALGARDAANPAEERMADALYGASGTDKTEEKQKLDTATEDLTNQLIIAKDNWEKFANAPETADVAGEIEKLAEQMGAAASSMDGLVEFTTAINTTTESTAGLIASVKELNTKAINKIEWLSKQVDKLRVKRDTVISDANASDDREDT